MYMLVRQKLNKISDLEILQFIKSDTKRWDFLLEKELLFHEQENVVGVGFHIRDRIKAYIDIYSEVNKETSVPFVIEIYKAAFPESKASTKFDILTDWLNKNDSKLFMATAIYFLNHFKGWVEAKTTYIY